MSVSDLASIAAHSTEPCPSEAGGNQRLAVALAESLGSAVHLDSPVGGIDWSGPGVRVFAGGRRSRPTRA